MFRDFTNSRFYLGLEPFVGCFLSDEIFSDHPELWELRSDDPQTLLEGFENGIKIAGENGDFIGIPNKGNDLYY